MLLDDLSNSYSQTDHPSARLFSSNFKGTVILKAASMLAEHITSQKKSRCENLNSNTNAFDEYQHQNHWKRRNKCDSWLDKYSKERHLTFNRIPIVINQSSNTNAEETESFSSPLMLIHKKRLSSDYFLSRMQNCTHPPYSQNHFYAFDQYNMLKLQRILHENEQSNFKRKYSETFEEEENEADYHSPDMIYEQTPPSKKQTPSPLRTADHISINKYHEDQIRPGVSEEKPESQMILSRLEKILNLCEELRTLATDVDYHLNEQPMYSLEKTEDMPIEKAEAEQMILDIYQELETRRAIEENTETKVESPYHPTKDTSSVHSDENKSEPITQTESFKTKSPSETIMRKPEDICACFLKSILEKEKCPLSLDEQEYLDQLTKAYLLGREQVLQEQNEENNKFQAFLNETLPDEFEEVTTPVLDINNNQSITPINSSSILISSSIPNSHEHTSTECGNITVKHQIFISEPIGSKSTNVLPGVGTKYTEQLASCGFPTVRHLLGFYLMIKNEQNFVHWLMNTPQLSTYSAWLCTKALRAWCQMHL